jgi:DNA-binding PadR family transcriptional regulator
MNPETELSTLSLAILGLISHRPLTGYDVRKAFQTTPMGHFSSSPGAIYPALKRIEEAGWIRSVTTDGRTGRQRVAYEITARGLKVFKEHLSQPVTQEDVTWRLDQLMLRFAFMDGVIGRDRIVQFLQEFAAQMDIHVAGLRRYVDSVKGIMPPCGRLALESGIEDYEMHARWARRAIQEVAWASCP